MKKFEVSANMKKEMLADFKASTIQFFEKEKIEFNPEYKKGKENLPEIMIEVKQINDEVGIEIKTKKGWLQKINDKDDPEKALEKFEVFTKEWFNENDNKWTDYYKMQEEEEEEEEESLEEILKKANVGVIDLTEMPKEKKKEILKEIIKRIKNK